MKIRKTLLTKGYTIIELMVTLTIFGIVALFAVPAFSTFIEKSRIKTQIIQAASFLRSAQEIAISSNRTVYVFTEGLSTYRTDNTVQRRDYWYKDWIMAFKPMGKQNISMAAQVNTLITSMNSSNHEYIIAKQRIFTFNQSQTYVLSIIDSTNHNNVLRNNLIMGGPTDDFSTTMEMEGYSRVRHHVDNVNHVDLPSHLAQGFADNGFVQGQPTFITFYPSGEVSLPIFIVSERTEILERLSNMPSTQNPSQPSFYDKSFSAAPVNGSPANSNAQWASLRQSIQQPIALLAGCRMGRSLTIDAINYTFNPEIIRQTDYIFASQGISTQAAFGIGNFIGASPTYSAAPSFGNYLCGSTFLK